MDDFVALAEVTRAFIVKARDKYGLGRFFPDELPLLDEMARLAKIPEGDPVEVRPSEPLAGSQAGLNGPSGSPTSPSGAHLLDDEDWIIPEGDERCDVLKDVCQCLKRKGHAGRHACAHGEWRADL